MNIIRDILLSSQKCYKHERIIPAIMIGQSKINAFFKRQYASGEDSVKTAISFCDDASECTLPVKRKRNENESEVS